MTVERGYKFSFATATKPHMVLLCIGKRDVSAYAHPKKSVIQGIITMWLEGKDEAVIDTYHKSFDTVRDTQRKARR